MKNSEAVRQLVYVRRNLDEYLDEDRINAVNDAISALEENDKLKAEIERLKKRLEIKDNNFELYSDALDEIEQLKATISKMETTTAQEDDLK